MATFKQIYGGTRQELTGNLGYSRYGFDGNLNTLRYIADRAADEITAKHSAFKSFVDLLNAEGGYFPTIRCNSTTGLRRAELTYLADAYDYFMLCRNDSRRAHRA